jgi:hypothetical protein
MSVSNELERMWMETDAACSKVLSPDFPEREYILRKILSKYSVSRPRFEVDTLQIQVKIYLLEATNWMRNLHADINVSEEHGSRV